MVIRKMYTSEWGQCSDEAGWHGWRYKWTNNESWYNTHEFYVVLHGCLPCSLLCQCCWHKVHLYDQQHLISSHSPDANQHMNNGNLTHPGIFLSLINSKSLQQLSSYSGGRCSSTFTVPADDVNTSLRTLPALAHDFMMLNTPFIVGLITSFCTYISMQWMKLERIWVWGWKRDEPQGPWIRSQWE